MGGGEGVCVLGGRQGGASCQLTCPSPPPPPPPPIPTPARSIASHFYVTYQTIATFSEHLKPTMGEIELLRLFALADEFKYMVVRQVGG